MPRTAHVAALVALVALLALAPAVGLVGAADAQEDSTTEETTNATAGQQLSTVIEVTDEEVRHEVEVSAFEAELDADDEAARAEAIAARSAELRNRSSAIVAEYEAARQAHENGELTRGEFAQRLAVLHARAVSVQRGFDRVESAANETSSLELESAGYDPEANAAAREDLRAVSGRGVGALMAQFTGEADGEFSVETEGGLEVEVESEDGERSREYERDEPEHGTFELDHAAADDAARAELSAPGDGGSWVLQSVKRDDDGYYELGYVYAGPDTTGEAEVGVDARDGSVFALEEELEPVGEDEDDEREDEREDESEDDEGDDDDAEEEQEDDDSEEQETEDDPEQEDETEDDESEDEQEDESEDDDAEEETEDDETEDEESEDDDAEEDESDDDDERGDESADHESLLAIHVADGELAPGATVTLQVTDVSGAPVADVPVRVDYEEVGTTDADGRLTVTLPDADDVSFDARTNEAEGELEVEFAGEDEGDSADRRAGQLDVSSSVADGTVTLTVAYAGEPVSDADVTVADESVGATDADGSVSFAAPDGEFDVELVRGEFEVKLDAEVRDGEFVVTEREFEVEDERESEEEREDESDDGDALDVTVVEGDAAPGATVTVRVVDDAGEPVAGATVEVESDEVGTTDAAGEIEVVLPEDEDDVRVRADHQEASGELELEFEDETETESEDD